MKTFVKRISILVVSFLVVVNGVAILSLCILNNTTFYKPSFLVNSVKEKQFDYIILGASTGLTTLNTKEIDKITGAKGVNLSVDDTSMASHYLMLQHFLAEGKQTKRCVVAPGLSSLDANSVNISDNDYRFLMFVNRDYVYDYYSKIGHSAKEIVLKNSLWMPFLGMSYYNTELFFPSLVCLVNPKKRNRFDDKGNYSYPELNTNFKSKQLKTKDIIFKNPYLNKIKKLCKANNIELILYFSPLRVQKITFQAQEFSIIDHSSFFNENIYFYDNIHVNSIGRKKVSKAFADILKKKLIKVNE